MSSELHLHFINSKEEPNVFTFGDKYQIHQDSAGFAGFQNFAILSKTEDWRQVLSARQSAASCAYNMAYDIKRNLTGVKVHVAIRRVTDDKAFFESEVT